jgi:hypothetical protein
MALPYPIALSQVDAKSPVDDNLMTSIKYNLDHLDQLLTQGGAPVYVWNVNGELAMLPNGIAKRVDMQFLHVAQQFTRVRVAQNTSGTSGKTEIDIRYHSNPKTPIVAITPQLSLNTNSIAQITPNLATQSIARATDPVATQSITRAKSSLSVQSIIGLGANLWRYNVSVSPDIDWKIGDSVTISGCTAGANNLITTIVEVNQSGFASIVVTNVSGVAQTAPAGTIELNCFSYNLVNPASVQFVVGEPVILSSHTNGLSNGTKTIYKTNAGGNNLWVKDPTGVTQGGVAGVVDTARWRYAYSAAVGTDFSVGQFVQFTGHSSAANNINAEIKALNVAGDNIIIVNASGVGQGSAAGVANTKRWKYTFSSNPSAEVLVADKVVMSGHTNPLNNGTFDVVEINNVTSDNIVIHNPAGVAQAGAAGQVNHTRKLVRFSSDQSLIYNLSSYIEIEGSSDANYNSTRFKLPYKVLQVNRGGGANYNVVIEDATGGTQASPAGYVAVEAKSIFNLADGSKPQVTSDMLGLSPNGLLKSVYESAAFNVGAIPQQTYIGLYILSVQSGRPRDLSIMLS